jgi:hypothetical protein
MTFTESNTVEAHPHDYRRSAASARSGGRIAGFECLLESPIFVFLMVSFLGYRGQA